MKQKCEVEIEIKERSVRSSYFSGKKRWKLNEKGKEICIRSSLKRSIRVSLWNFFIPLLSHKIAMFSCSCLLFFSPCFHAPVDRFMSYLSLSSRCFVLFLRILSANFSFLKLFLPCSKNKFSVSFRPFVRVMKLTNFFTFFLSRLVIWRFLIRKASRSFLIFSRGSIKFAYPNCYVFYLINNEAESELYAKLNPREEPAENFLQKKDEQKKVGQTFIMLLRIILRSRVVVFVRRKKEINEINSKSLHNSTRKKWVDDEGRAASMCAYMWAEDGMRFGNRNRQVDVDLFTSQFVREEVCSRAIWSVCRSVYSAKSDKHEKFQQFSARTRKLFNFLWIVKNFTIFSILSSLHFPSLWFSIFPKCKYIRIARKYFRNEIFSHPIPAQIGIWRAKSTTTGVKCGNSKTLNWPRFSVKIERNFPIHIPSPFPFVQQRTKSQIS